jgi:hypothetical protein
MARLTRIPVAALQPKPSQPAQNQHVSATPATYSPPSKAQKKPSSASLLSLYEDIMASDAETIQVQQATIRALQEVVRAQRGMMKDLQRLVDAQDAWIEDQVEEKKH